MPADKAAIEELSEIINRALTYVQYLRADAVDEVTHAFQVAVKCLEDNLEKPHERNQMIHSATDNLKRIAVQMEQDGGTGPAKSAKVNKPIPKNRIKSGVTIDFDSPGSQTRRLGGAKKRVANEGGLGLGMGGGGMERRGLEDRDENMEPAQRPANKNLAALGGRAAADKQGKNFTKDKSSPALATRKLGGVRPQPQQEDNIGFGRGQRKQEGWGMADREFGAERDTNREMKVESSPQMDRPHQDRLMSLAMVSGAEKVNTPKAAFIRRLDGPGGGGGNSSGDRRLMQAKENLNAMLKKALTDVPQMKMSEYLEIKSKFEKALNLLRAGSDTKFGKSSDQQQQQQSYNNYHDNY